MAKKAAKSIALKDLTVAVEKAIRLEKNKIVPDTISHTHPGIIFGMRMEGGTTLEEAHAVAERITKSVVSTAKSVGFPDLTPSVLIHNKLITVGFIGPTQVFSANE